MKDLSGGRVDVLSAGSEPKDQINPVAVEVMAESGIDIAGNAPKILTVDAVQGIGRRDHHGLRRHLSDLPGQALQGLGSSTTRRVRANRGAVRPIQR